MPLEQPSASSFQVRICVAQSCTVHHTSLVHQLGHCAGMTIQFLPGLRGTLPIDKLTPGDATELLERD